MKRLAFIIMTLLSISLYSESIISILTQNSWSIPDWKGTEGYLSVNGETLPVVFTPDTATIGRGGSFQVTLKVTYGDSFVDIHDKTVKRYKLLINGKDNIPTSSLKPNASKFILFCAAEPYYKLISCVSKSVEDDIVIFDNVRMTFKITQNSSPSSHVTAKVTNRVFVRDYPSVSSKKYEFYMKDGKTTTPFLLDLEAQFSEYTVELRVVARTIEKTNLGTDENDYWYLCEFLPPCYNDYPPEEYLVGGKSVQIIYGSDYHGGAVYGWIFGKYLDLREE